MGYGDKRFPFRLNFMFWVILNHERLPSTFYAFISHYHKLFQWEGLFQRQLTFTLGALYIEADVSSSSDVLLLSVSAFKTLQKRLSFPDTLG